jgi:hypothetical protein
MAAAAITAAAAIAACGSNSPSPPNAANSGGQPSQAQRQRDQQDAVRFAGCMRSHGVPNFPDPGSPAFKNEFNTRTPARLSADAACQHLMPRGGSPNQSPAHGQAQIAAMLAFARCLRSHGFPTFPDPTSGGDVTHEMLASAGINLQQPAVLQAADACTSVTHGVITKTVVARFIAGQ